jgi:SAM-dependent methyltransferase
VDGPDPAQYDAFADEYEAHAAEAPYNALYDRPATLEVLGDVQGRHILDAACGPGFYLEELRRLGASVSGCDASPRMVELARARVGDDVEVRVHSLDEPLRWLPDGSVDVVLCALAYHYLNDRQAFLAEASRVLVPGGRLVISTNHPTGDWAHLGGSYFEVGTVTETWTRGWVVTQWRMPLSVMLDEIGAAGFGIRRLVEPRPLPEMARIHPETFDRLSREPAFLILDLGKPD